jgi:sulfatase maturation enzyme AslB (radical SAM superfamily)
MCKTCFIWKQYKQYPLLEEKEFKTWEFEKTFQALERNPIWFVISGGEPYLRNDLVKICRAAYEYCSPQGITIPTNALLPKIIENNTKKILEQCSNTYIGINVSLDGIGEKHDYIRGIHGNFSKFIDTYQRLKKLKSEFSNLNIGIHSVISNYNIMDIVQLYNFIKTLKPDSYISEVAEERTELFNMRTNITPNINEYKKIINILSEIDTSISYCVLPNDNSTSMDFKSTYTLLCGICIMSD